MENRLIDIKELSAYIATPVTTIYGYVYSKTIPADCIIRIGRRLKFDKAAVDRWISGIAAAQANAPK